MAPWLLHPSEFSFSFISDLLTSYQPSVAPFLPISSSCVLVHPLASLSRFTITTFDPGQSH